MALDRVKKVSAAGCSLDILSVSVDIGLLCSNPHNIRSNPCIYFLETLPNT